MSQDSYAGTGVYRLDRRRRELPAGGRRSRATTRWRRTRCSGSRSTRAATPTRPPTTACSGTAAGTGSWTEVLDPAGPTDFPPYDQQVTDVAVVPGLERRGRHRRDRLARAGQHRRTTASTSRPTAAITFSEVTPDRRHQRQRHRPDHVRLLGGRQQAVRDRAVARRCRPPVTSPCCRASSSSRPGKPGQRDRPVDEDRRRGHAGRLRLGTGRRLRLRRRRSGLVQPGPGGRPQQPQPRVRRAGGGLRVHQRRQHLGDRQPVLELHLRLRRHGHLPATPRIPTSTP